MRNEGSVVWVAGTISGGEDALIDNVGSFEARGDDVIQHNVFVAGTLTFHNRGSFTKSGGTGATTVVLFFDNDGVLAAGAGTLRLHGGDNGASETGEFAAAAGATLDFAAGSYSLAAGASVSGPGTVAVSGAEVGFGGTYAVSGSTAISAGTANFSGPASTVILSQSGGTVGGAGVLSVSGSFGWSGGSQTGAGQTTIAVGASATIDAGAFGVFLSGGRTVRNDGSVVWVAGTISGGEDALIDNVGSFEARGDDVIQHNVFVAGTLTFHNSGSFTKSGGTGTTTITTPFDNDGTLEIAKGIVRTGSYSQSAAGTLHVHVGGLTVGTGFTQLDAIGPATLAGTLRITTEAGFTPVAGQSFRILNANPRAGTFSSILGADAGGGLTYAVQYDDSGATLVVGTAADLSVSKSDSPDPVLAGQPLTYTLTVANTGPSAATDVSMSDPLPAGVTFESADSGCSEAAGMVTCAVGTVANGASVSRQIVVLPAAAGSLSNTATVSSTPADPNGANNSATEATTVDPAADLRITKSDSPDPVTVGATVTYTLTVTNAGPSAASAASMSDTLPAGVTFVSADAGCSEAAGTVTCALGPLANGATASREILVRPTAAGPLSNSATVSSSTADPNAGNNSATEATTVVAQPTPTLSVVKEVVNDDGGTRAPADFSLHVKAAGVDVAGSPQAGSAAGTTYTLEPGTYTVSEDELAGYAASFLGACDASGQVTLAPGEQKTCTIRNDDVAPSLTVIKRVVNDNGGTAVAGDWTMHIKAGVPLADVAGKSPFPGEPDAGHDAAAWRRARTWSTSRADRPAIPCRSRATAMPPAR